MFKNVALMYLLRQSFWLFAFGLLLAGQLQALPHSFASTSVPEISNPGVNSLPLASLTFVLDVDDCPDALLLTAPEVPLSNAAGLPSQQSSARLLCSATGVSFTHLARPPPTFFS